MLIRHITGIRFALHAQFYAKPQLWNRLLDDENQVIRPLKREFDDLTVIHRYESVMLYVQAIFVLDRPKSRLAREYRRLVSKLIMHNPADRAGALRYLIEYDQCLRAQTSALNAGNCRLNLLGKIMLMSPPDYGYRPMVEEVHPIDQIASNFPHDADIQAQITRCREAAERMKAALKEVPTSELVGPD